MKYWLLNHKYDIGLMAFVLVTRLPFHAWWLYSWDAAQFGLGVERFDVVQHQPHPPGYILYIALVKIVHLVIPDVNAAMVLLSIVASCLFALTIFRLVDHIVNEKRLSFILTLTVSSLPLVWFFGLEAATYIFDALFGSLFLLLSLRSLEKNSNESFLWFSFLLALAGGIRTSISVIFFPLWLYTCALLIRRRQLTFKYFLKMVLISSVTTSFWLIPLVFLSGGWASYQQATSSLFKLAASSTSIFSGIPFLVIVTNAKNIIWMFIAGCGTLGLLFMGASRVDSGWTKTRLGVVLIAIVPSVLVYFFVHLGNVGYLMTLIPGWVVFMVLCLSKRNAKTLVALSLLVILLNVTQFFPPTIIEHRLARLTSWYQYLSYDFVVKNDDRLEKIAGIIRQNSTSEMAIVTLSGYSYRPAESGVWVNNYAEYFRQLEYYFPDYATMELFGNAKGYFITKNHSPLVWKGEAEIHLPTEIKKLLVITEGIDRDAVKGDGLTARQILKEYPVFEIKTSDVSKIEFLGYKFSFDVTGSEWPK